MPAQDFFYYALGVGILTISVVVAYLIYHLVKIIKKAELIVDDAESITHDIALLKEQIKMGSLGAIAKIVRLITKYKRG